MTELRVQYGAGRTAAPGWLNYDASPSVWLERLPAIGKLIRINEHRFPENILYGDIVTGLPVAAGSVTAAYASHILEHLSYDDFWQALRNTYIMLAPGGVFRLIVPDLQARASRYISGAALDDPEAASRFMREACLGRQSRARTLPQMIRGILGNSDHLWMWDEASIADALRRVGFAEVRRCSFGDATDPAFALVESADRFTDTDTGIVEVAMEAIKPASTS